ncbi:MMPL family transporter, partial [Halapricum sp. CBA1109]|uniref:MMPL family transporter n=1 Tax=Halapricum sp. CBA1109 TaxID=2668068 RepID=UPI0012FA8B32
MERDPIGWTVGVVTTHSVAVVVLLLVATAGVAAGIPQLDFTTADNSNATGDTTAAQKADYADEHFDRGPTFRPERPGGGPTSGEQRPSANESADAPNSTADSTGTSTTEDDGQRSGENRTVRTVTTRHVVYVYDADGDVLSRSSLLESLRFHERLSAVPSIEGRLDGKGGVRGVATLVGRQAADDPNATLAEQRAAVEELDRSEIAALVESSIERRPTAARLLPEGYEPNGSAVHVRRLAVEPTVNLSAPPAGRSYQGTARAIHRTAEGFGTAEYFTLGTAAREDLESAWNRNTLELVVPVSVLLILAVLAFAYRDIVDVVVGLLGVGISLVWTFGILGWLGVAAGAMIIVGPVLIVGLSVDYGLHVFMRHREQRRDDDGGPRGPMTRSLRSVALALVLVTVTTGIGFTANVTSDFQSIRNLAVGITLGVVSALVVFTTLVPAAKLVVDDALEAVGLDRRKTPLGSGRFLRPVLTSGVTLARRAAPVVVALALVAGLAGGAA